MSHGCLQNFFLGLVLLSMHQTRVGPHQLCHSTTAVTKRKLLQRKGKEESYLGNRRDKCKTEFSGNQRKFQQIYLSSPTRRQFSSRVAEGQDLLIQP